MEARLRNELKANPVENQFGATFLHARPIF
jgi:hypothetical protein